MISSSFGTFFRMWIEILELMVWYFTGISFHRYHTKLFPSFFFLNQTAFLISPISSAFSPRYFFCFSFCFSKLFLSNPSHVSK